MKVRITINTEDNTNTEHSFEHEIKADGYDGQNLDSLVDAAKIVYPDATSLLITVVF